MAAFQTPGTHGANVEVLREFPPPALETAWRGLLSRVPAPSHYTSPEWFREPYFDGKRPFALLAMDGDEGTGAVTGFHDGRSLNAGLPTRPQLQVLEDARAESTLDALAGALLHEGTASELVNLYTWRAGDLPPLRALGFRPRQTQRIPVLDLTLGAETLLRQCDGKRRNAIRAAMKNGLDISAPATEEEYRAFFDIYKSWCAAKRVHCYTWETELRAWQETAGNRYWLLARKDGRVIAGSVFRYYPGGMLEYSRNASLPEFQRLKPNDLLAWRGLEAGIALGCRTLSMGGSHRFLREFGGEPSPVFRWRLDRTPLRRHDRREAATDAARSLVSRLPAQWQARVRRMLGKEIPQGW